MINNIATADGQLGYSASKPPVYCVGPASAGSTSSVKTFGDASLVRGEYTTGKLPDRASLCFTQKIGSVACLRMATSTSGSEGTAVKTPATTPAAVNFFGALIRPSANQNGLMLIAKDTGVTVTIVVAGNNTPLTVPAVVGKALIINQSTDGGGVATGTATLIAAAIAAEATAIALVSAAALGAGSAIPLAQAAIALDKGTMALTAKVQNVRVRLVQGGAASALDASASGQDVTITLGGDANGINDITKNTEALVAAKIAAVTAVNALISAAAVGDGTGLVGAVGYTAVPYGSTGTITAAGSAVDQYNLQVKIIQAGGLGVGTFEVALDDLPTWGPETQIPGGGTYLIPGTGITLTFVGTFAAADAWAIPVTSSTSTSADLIAALAVLSGLTGQGGDLHILGGLSGAQAAVITSWIATERTAGRIWVVAIESRDYTSDSETDSTFVASVNADYASVLEPQGRLWGVPGWWDTVIPNQGISRRPFAWAAVTQVWALPTYVNPVCIEDGGGPIPGLYTPTTPIQPRTHDERLSPGLGGSGGRWATVQSLPGVPGQWYLGDAAGNRSPGTFAAGTSDWSLLMNARLGAQTERLLLAYGPNLLGTRYNTIPPGQVNAGALTAAERKRVAAKIRSYLQDQLGQALAAPPIVEISPTEPIKTSKKLKYNVKLPTWGYALEIDGVIGLQ